MKKWLDKYNDDIPQAQNGIEGTMGGLTDVGFNYNGAWGGTMQMGGNMPGAVGFTYARTAGAAPANGPYAKKTKASAQDGVKKPLVKLSPDELKMERLKQYAQRASKKEQPIVQPRGSMSDAARKQLYEDAQRSELKNQFLKTADVATDLMQFGNFVPNPVGQAIGTAGNILGGWVDSYQAYDAYNKGNYGDAAINAASVALPMGLGSSTFRRNSKYLKPGQPLYPLSPQANLPASSINAPRVNYIEPFTKVKGMTDANLLANRALLGTLGAETVYDAFQNGGEMKYYQEGLDFRPKTISQDGSKTPKKKKTLILAEHDPEYWNNPDGSFSDRYINPFMTEAAGIKKYVNKYFPNEDVEIIPTYKQNIKEVLTKSDPNTRLVVMGHHGDKMFGIPSSEFVESIGNTKYENCYAGICYGDDLPGIGRPSSESMLTYLSRREDDQNKKITTRYPESYNLNNFNIRTDNLPWLGFAPVDRGGEEGFKDSFFRRTKNPEIIKLQKQIRNIWDNSKEDYNVKSRKAAPIEAQLHKLYKKGEAVNMPKAVNTKELDYVPLPGRVYNYNDPLQFNPQQILQKKEQGGSIISPLGQWAYPGEITTIPSNQITMQGVPYPVLGISDVGDTQMMYPGEDYTFDGDYVTEYPMAQKGISVPAPTTADSARLYNAQVALNNFYNKEIKAGRIKKTAVAPTFGEFYMPNRQLNYQNLGFYRDEIAYRKDKGKGTYDDEYKKIFNLSPEQVRDLENRGLAQTKSGSNYQQYYRDLVTPMQNLAAPFALVDERIVPQRTVSYDAGNIMYPGGDVIVYDYDPLAIKPYNMRTPQEKIEWEKKYGNPPVTLKPKPIVKPIVKPKERPPLQKVERLERPSLETPSVVGTNKQVEQKKTEYSYTVPTFDKDVQKTMYFPDEKSFKEFTDKYGYTSRSLTNKSGSATGYPQFKDGGVSINEVDAQPIKKLDQLLNFTNYNKPTKGGWLDKYQ